MEIGLLFAAWIRSLFLNMGCTIAYFYIAGIPLVYSNLWKSCASAGASSFDLDC